MVGAVSPLWVPLASGSTSDPFSSTMLSIARGRRRALKYPFPWFRTKQTAGV